MSFEVTVTPTVYDVEVDVNPSVQPFDVEVTVGNVPDLDLTTNGDSGASTFDPLTGELNIPNYTLDGLGGVPESRTLTINGTTQDLSANRTFTIPAPDPVTIGSPANGLAIDGNQVLTIGLASGSQAGALSSTDWSTFNNKQNAIGYTPENVANKAINFTSPDDTKYPTTLAVSTALAGKQDTLTNPVTGTGASGQVAFWNGTSTQSGDNGLFWDNSTKNLRINQSTDAGFRLDVNGTARVQGDLTVNGVNIGLGGGAVSTNTIVGLNAGQNNTTGTSNSFFGRDAGRNNTTGVSNSFFGVNAGLNNTTGNNNSFFGVFTGFANTTGGNNSFFGLSAGQNNTTGTSNSFFGLSAGQNNTTGTSNSFFGLNAGQNNTTGTSNSFFGLNAGRNNTTAGNNSIFGVNAGLNNTTGNNNSFFGLSAGQNNTTGVSNSFFGVFTGLNNTTGVSNSFFGFYAGLNNTTGNNNSFFGLSAGRFLADGSTSLTIANNSVFLGANTRANADNQTNQIAIGYQAIGLGSNTTVIGNSSTTFGRWWGRLLIGTSTDAGFDLDVNGTARVQGNVTLSGQTIFQNLVIGQGIAIEYQSSGIARFYNSNNTLNLSIYHDGTGLLLTGATAISGNLTIDTNTLFVDATNKSVGIGTTSINSSAILQLNSTTKGLLPPRMTGAQAEAISSPAEGLLVYSTDGTGTTITSKGWWGFDGSTWAQLN